MHGRETETKTDRDRHTDKQRQGDRNRQRQTKTNGDRDKRYETNVLTTKTLESVLPWCLTKSPLTLSAGVGTSVVGLDQPSNMSSLYHGWKKKPKVSF